MRHCNVEISSSSETFWYRCRICLCRVSKRKDSFTLMEIGNWAFTCVICGVRRFSRQVPDFDWDKRKNYGHKWHLTRGSPGNNPPTLIGPRTILEGPVCKKSMAIYNVCLHLQRTPYWRHWKIFGKNAWKTAFYLSEQKLAASLFSHLFAKMSFWICRHNKYLGDY